VYDWIAAWQSIELMLQTPQSSYGSSTDVPFDPILNVLQHVYQGKKQPSFLHALGQLS
jgi:hypothetical protein